MDEPTAPLTEREVSVLFRIIQELKASGITIIYISHRLDELYEVSDRVTVMRDGCYITTTDTANVTKDQLIAYMVGRELKKDFAERNSRTEEVLLETKNLGGNGVEPFSIKLHKGEVLGFGGLVGAGRTEYAQLIFGAAPKRMWLHIFKWQTGRDQQSGRCSEIWNRDGSGRSKTMRSVASHVDQGEYCCFYTEEDLKSFFICRSFTGKKDCG